MGLIRGGDGPTMRVMAHLDELSMLVKRVEADGSLRLAQLGTMYPANFGLGPVAVLGGEPLVGVLAVGSEHTTQESRQIWETKPGGVDKARRVPAAPAAGVTAVSVSRRPTVWRGRARRV